MRGIPAPHLSSTEPGFYSAVSLMCPEGHDFNCYSDLDVTVCPYCDFDDRMINKIPEHLMIQVKLLF